MLDHPERRFLEPGLADRLPRQRGVARAGGGFECLAVGGVEGVPPARGIAVGEGGIFAGMDVAQVAGDVHRLMIADQA